MMMVILYNVKVVYKDVYIVLRLINALNANILILKEHQINVYVPMDTMMINLMINVNNVYPCVLNAQILIYAKNVLFLIHLE